MSSCRSTISTSASLISTGSLPVADQVKALLVEAHDRYRDLDEGEVADYIPALASVSPSLFGACIVGAQGDVVLVGDADHEFSIQSVSKPFVFALVCEAIGVDAAPLGVNSTGLRSTRSWPWSSTNTAR